MSNALPGMPGKQRRGKAGYITHQDIGSSTAWMPKLRGDCVDAHTERARNRRRSVQMNDVSAIASLSTSLSQNQVETAVAVKTLKLANDQQKSVASLLDAAVESAAQIQSHESGKGAAIDVQG